MIVLIVISWCEIFDVFDSSCKDEDFSTSFLAVRFAVYLISRFYMLSLMNIELLSKSPYSTEAWKGLWPPAFQATSFLILADLFTFDYVECLPFHETFSLKTGKVFCLLSMIFTIISAILVILKHIYKDDVDVSEQAAKILKRLNTGVLCLVLLFFNCLFMIVVYSQMGSSTPLLYIEYILHHSLFIIWLGRLLRTLYKKCAVKKYSSNDTNMKNKDQSPKNDSQSFPNHISPTQEMNIALAHLK